jgi:hypothetical protein
LFVADPVVTPLTELTTIGTLHVICGFSALVLLPFAALLINLDMARGNPAVAAALRWTAGLPLAGLVLHWVLSLAVLSHPGDLGGRVTWRRSAPGW